MILCVNGEDFVGINYDTAASILKTSTGLIKVMKEVNVGAIYTFNNNPCSNSAHRGQPKPGSRQGHDRPGTASSRGCEGGRRSCCRRRRIQAESREAQVATEAGDRAQAERPLPDPQADGHCANRCGRRSRDCQAAAAAAAAAAGRGREKTGGIAAEKDNGSRRRRGGEQPRPLRDRSRGGHDDRDHEGQRRGREADGTGAVDCRRLGHAARRHLHPRGVREGRRAQGREAQARRPGKEGSTELCPLTSPLP